MRDSAPTGKAGNEPAIDAPGWRVLEVLADRAGFTVKTTTDHNVPGSGANDVGREFVQDRAGEVIGRTDYGTKEIWISLAHSPELAAQTLAHELAHVIDVAVMLDETGKPMIDTPTARAYGEVEIRVDVAATLAMAMFGVDTSLVTALYVGQQVELGLVTEAEALAAMDAGSQLFGWLRDGVRWAAEKTGTTLVHR